MCGGPKAKTQAPPPPVELPQAASEVDQSVIQARARERARNRSLFGHTRTILTGGRGLEGVQANLARRTLLGSRADSREMSTEQQSSTTSPTTTAQTSAASNPVATGVPGGASVIGGFTGSSGGGAGRSRSGLSRVNYY